MGSMAFASLGVTEKNGASNALKSCFKKCACLYLEDSCSVLWSYSSFAAAKNVIGTDLPWLYTPKALWVRMVEAIDVVAILWDF